MRNTVLIVGVALLLLTISANATPIRPDIRKLVSDPAQDTIQFAPARAGWNGPEAAGSSAEFSNPAVERLTPAASARELRASLLALAVPDWRIVLIVLGVIILLRSLRRKPASQATPERRDSSKYVPPAETMRPAA